MRRNAAWFNDEHWLRYTFRVARTQYMQNVNTPENTQQKAAHASIKTNNLHNRVRTPSYASKSNA